MNNAESFSYRNVGDMKNGLKECRELRSELIDAHKKYGDVI